MSVPTWMRSEAKTRFLYRLYKLNVRIGEIVANHPTKYRASYGDTLITNALNALTHAEIGNGIFMHNGTTEGDYQLRRKHLREAKGYTEAVATVAYIYLELTAKTDGVKKEKILKQEEEIGLECAEISKMIKGVLDSDRKIYNSRPRGPQSARNLAPEEQ